jgi:hypothetical protein
MGARELSPFLQFLEASEPGGGQLAWGVGMGEHSGQGWEPGRKGAAASPLKSFLSLSLEAGFSLLHLISVSY